MLEIGAGTGLNIPAYPRTGITRLVLTEPHEPMRRQIDAKTADAPAPVEIVDATAERLPFDDATFDTVTGTLVLCEADDPAVAVDEIARVLKPGGRYLFLEHVRSDDPALARKQDRWAPLWRSGGRRVQLQPRHARDDRGLGPGRRAPPRRAASRSPRASCSPLLSGVAVRGDVL